MCTMPWLRTDREASYQGLPSKTLGSRRSSAAVFVALMLLYKVFGTFRESLLVLLSLPLAMTGGVVSLYFAGADLSVAAVIGSRKQAFVLLVKPRRGGSSCPCVAGGGNGACLGDPFQQRCLPGSDRNRGVRQDTNTEPLWRPAFIPIRGGARGA